MNQPALKQSPSLPSTVDSTDTYYGDYLISVDEESGVTIMQELDELVLNMSIEE